MAANRSLSSLPQMTPSSFHAAAETMAMTQLLSKRKGASADRGRRPHNCRVKRECSFPLRSHPAAKEKEKKEKEREAAPRDRPRQEAPEGEAPPSQTVSFLPAPPSCPSPHSLVANTSVADVGTPRSAASTTPVKHSQEQKAAVSSRLLRSRDPAAHPPCSAELSGRLQLLQVLEDSACQPLSETTDASTPDSGACRPQLQQRRRSSATLFSLHEPTTDASDAAKVPKPTSEADGASAVRTTTDGGSVGGRVLPSSSSLEDDHVAALSALVTPKTNADVSGTGAAKSEASSVSTCGRPLLHVTGKQPLDDVQEDPDAPILMRISKQKLQQLGVEPPLVSVLLSNRGCSPLPPPPGGGSVHDGSHPPFDASFSFDVSLFDAPLDTILSSTISNSTTATAAAIAAFSASLPYALSCAGDTTAYVNSRSSYESAALGLVRPPPFYSSLTSGSHSFLGFAGFATVNSEGGKKTD